MKPKVITLSTSSASNPSSPSSTPGGWSLPRPAGDRGKFREEQYHHKADEELVVQLVELFASAKNPAQKESWQKNRAIELVRLHVLIPAIKPGTPPDSMKFAPLGSVEGPNDLPTRLMGSSTLALSKVFPNNKPQANREIVQTALSYIKRWSNNGPEGQEKLRKHISMLEDKYLGPSRSPPDSVPQTAFLSIVLFYYHSLIPTYLHYLLNFIIVLNL